MKILTRKQYMDGEVTFEQYYGQYVNEGVKRVVLSYFSAGVLADALKKDEHLNNLPMKSWDAMGGFAFRGSEMVMRPTTIEPVDYKMMKEAGEGVSPATMVCIYKTAARQIVEEMGKTHKVTRDGEFRFAGTENECFEWLLKHQSQSVDWAIKYEGYKIEENK